MKRPQTHTEQSIGHDPKVVASFLVFSHVAAAIAFGFGFLTLIGWSSGNEFLMGLGTGNTAMNPTTAVLFIVTALSLYLSHKDMSPGIRKVSGVLACVVIAISFFKIISFFGYDFQIDQILFTEAINNLAVPNRMAPNTTLNFFIVGWALYLLHTGKTKKVRIGQYLSLTSLVISFIAVIGYIYGASYLYGVASYIPMALNTAIAFLSINLAIIFSQPTVGIASLLTSDAEGGAFARAMLPWAIEIPSVLGYLRLLGEKADLYGTELGVTIFVVIIVLIFAWFIIKNAKILEKIDRESKHLITELTHDRNRLHEDHMELESVGEAYPAGLMMVKIPSGRTVLINSKARKILGIDNIPATATENFTAHFPFVKSTGEPIPVHTIPLFSAAKGRSAVVSTDMYIKKGDSLTHVELRAEPIISDNKVVASLMTLQIL